MIFPQLILNTGVINNLIPLSLLATAEEESAQADGALVLASVLLSLVAIYIASKIGGELCARINLPPVLGELVGGVVIGVSVLSRKWRNRRRLPNHGGARKNH